MIARRDVPVALASGCAGALLALALGRPLPALIATAVTVALVSTAAAVDLRSRRIPNALTYGGVAGALLLAVSGGTTAIVLAAAGLALAVTVMGLLYVVGRGALGLGDVKLAAAIGAVLGPAGVPIFLLATAAAGGVAGLVMLTRGRSRRDAIPYAPALAVGALYALVASGTVV